MKGSKESQNLICFRDEKYSQQNTGPEILPPKKILVVVAFWLLWYKTQVKQVKGKEFILAHSSRHSSPC